MELFAYSGKVRLIRALKNCKQRSLTASKKAPTVSKKASPAKKASVNLHPIALTMGAAVKEKLRPPSGGASQAAWYRMENGLEDESGKHLAEKLARNGKNGPKIAEKYGNDPFSVSSPCF